MAESLKDGLENNTNWETVTINASDKRNGIQLSNMVSG